MDTPENTMNSALIYLNTYVFGLIFCVMYNIFSSILRALGDSKSPFYVLVFASLLNIGLDLLFMINLNMGVFGAALATVLAQGVSAIILAVILAKTLPKTERKAKFSTKVMADISALGFPAGAQSLMYGLSNMLMQTAINSLGVTAVAAWVAYIKIDSIVEIFVGAAGVTALTFVGQNFGAGRMDRATNSVKKILQIGFVLTASITVIFEALTDAEIETFSTILNNIKQSTINDDEQ